MKKIITYFGILTLTLYGCFRQTSYYKIVGSTQGTTYEIEYSSNKNYKAEIDSILKEIDLTFSTYNPNSIISRINNNDPNVKLNEHFIKVFNKSIEISEASDGLFDITVGPLVELYGFGPDKPATNVSQHVIDSILQFVGYKKVHIINGKFVKDDPRIKIDMNAIAQGYTVDVISHFLDNKDIDNYYIDVGGEVMVKGKNEFNEPWRIGIEKPIENTTVAENPLQLVIQISGEKKAIATSGNYRRFYVKNGVKYTHTINPKTGRTVRDSLLSVSIMADDCTTADGYATACLVSGFKNGIKLAKKIKNIEGFFIYVDYKNNYRFFFTKGFKKYITE